MKFFYPRLKQWVILLIACWVSTAVFAQYGGSYFANFEFKDQSSRGKCYSIAQDNEGNLLLATLRGVVVFDGSESSLTGTGSFIYKLKWVESETAVFAACEGNIGYFQKDQYGKYVFQKIDCKAEETESFFNVLNIGNQIYFQSNHRIVLVSGKKFVKEWKIDKKRIFNGMLSYGQQLCASIIDEGLFKAENSGGLTKLAAGESEFAQHEILFSIEKKSGEILVALSNNKLYQLANNALSLFPHERSGWAETKGLLDGQRINEDHAVIASLSGGICVINIFNGAVIENFNSGLGFPDDQIYAIGVDQHLGIWASHETGLTRIDRNIPLRNYSAYPGLTTKIYTAAELNSNLYVGAADGLYILRMGSAEEFNQALQNSEKAALEKKKNPSLKEPSEETNNLPEITNPSTSEPAIDNSNSAPVPNATEQTKPSDNLIDKATKKIRGLFRKKPNNSNEGEKNLNPDEGKNSDKSKDGVGLILRKNRFYNFASFAQTDGNLFIYKKVAGVSGKVKKLFAASVGLFVASTDGLFLVNGENIAKISDNEILDITQGKATTIYFSKSDGVYLRNQFGETKKITTKTNLKNFSQLFYDGRFLWIGGLNKVIKCNISLEGICEKEELIPLPNNLLDIVNPFGIDDKIYFATMANIFEFDNVNNKIKVSPLFQNKLDENNVEFLLSPSQNFTAIHTREGWIEFSKTDKNKLLGFLDAFESPRSIYKTETGNYWVVTVDGKIYMLNKTMIGTQSNKNFSVFFKTVSGADGKNYNLNDLKISYREGLVEFKWGSNILLKNEANWYQYKIGGTNNSNWSSWTKNTSLKLQLKPGNYTFSIRAKDIYGNISTEKTISFTIEPPFWQTWWFYTMIGLGLIGLVYYIFKWRNKALLENQKKLENMVTLRTEELEKEKEKTEDLLLNILPKKIAQELKDSGQSSVRSHEQSAVLFTDFCNFTKNSQHISAEELVAKLHRVFSKFDTIVDKYGAEKIKTIGDAYMVASGVPEPQANSSAICALIGLEILETIKEENKLYNTDWEIRIGIHSGNLVSGVVGTKKFAYDIWGSTVNIASRMESAGTPMTVNVSEKVFQEISEYFICEKRENIETKSLGKTNMYAVVGIKEEWKQKSGVNSAFEYLFKILQKN